MTRPRLDFTAERSIVVRASQPTVFRYFTDPTSWESWWGSGSRITPVPDGEVYIRYPNGTEARGEVVEIEPEHRIAFTFGYVTGKPIPVGASRVTMMLETVADGTRVSLRHQLPDRSSRDAHGPGWRYQLALLANAVANREFATAHGTVDRYFAAWSETDPTHRRRALERVVSDDVQFRDAFSCIDGRDDLNDHLTAYQTHMPGLSLSRVGAIRHCQGTVLADWTGTGADGRTVAAGTTVFEIDPSGLARRIVGFWRQEG